MIDLNLCKEGDKLKTIHGTILTYICKLPPGSYYEHKIQYPDGSFGTRTDEGFTYKKNRLLEDEDVCEIIGQ